MSERNANAQYTHRGNDCREIYEILKNAVIPHVQAQQPRYSALSINEEKLNYQGIPQDRRRILLHDNDNDITTTVFSVSFLDQQYRQNRKARGVKLILQEKDDTLNRRSTADQLLVTSANTNGPCFDMNKKEFWLASGLLDRELMVHFFLVFVDHAPSWDLGMNLTEMQSYWDDYLEKRIANDLNDVAQRTLAFYMADHERLGGNRLDNQWQRHFLRHQDLSNPMFWKDARARTPAMVPISPLEHFTRAMHEIDSARSPSRWAARRSFY